MKNIFKKLLIGAIIGNIYMVATGQYKELFIIYKFLFGMIAFLFVMGLQQIGMDCADFMSWYAQVNNEFKSLLK